MDFASLGVGLGGIGDAAQGIKSLFGGSKRGPSVEDQLAANLQAEQNSFAYRMHAAEKYGISKLAMLGVPSFNAPGFQFGSTGYDRDMSSIGQNLGRAASALGTIQDRAASRKFTELQLEGAQLDNDYKRSLIRGMTAPGTPPPMPTSDTRYPVQGQMPMGYGDTAPLLRMGRDTKGNPIRVYNDDLGDNEILQAVTGVGMSIPDWIHGNIGRPAARWLRRNFLRGKALGRQYRYFNK